MLYSEKHNACVYQLSEDTIQGVLSVISSARRVSPGVLAVPCRLWEMQVMRRLGHAVMSPIIREYHWPGRFTPFDHQRIMSAFLTMHPRCFNLSDIGTGKTLGTLWAADFLMRQGAIHKALVLSPLSTIHRVWQDELFTHFLGDRKGVVLHGSRDKRIELLSTDADFYVLNHDGLGVGTSRNVRGLVLGDFAEKIISRADIDMVIVDEGSVYKDSTTLRAKVLRRVIKDKPYVWWLTGTPTPNAPTDAWSQARLVKPDYQESLESFRMRTMMKVTNFKWAARPDSSKVAASILSPAVRFHRSECLDLPPCQYVSRDVELTPEQKKAAQELKTQLCAAITGGAVINAVNEAALRIKLLQVSMGAIYDATHNTHKIDCGPRLKVMREIIEQTEEKLLIFAPLTSVVNLLYSDLRKDYSVEMVNGEVNASKRSEIFRAFQQGRDPRIIVADPRTMAHGLTLTEASTIIWYGPTDMPEVYTQANGRINRPGQRNNTLIIRLTATALEREIFHRLDTKQSVQGAVLQYVKEGLI